MKSKLVLIIIFFTIGVIIGGAVVFFIISDREADLEIIAPEAVSQEFFKGQTVTGYFTEIDVENNLILLEAYDSLEKKEVILPIKLTEKTEFFLRKSLDAEESLYLGDYSGAIDFLTKGINLTIYIKDNAEELEALTVEIYDEFFIFEPAVLESL